MRHKPDRSIWDVLVPVCSVIASLARTFVSALQALTLL